MKKLTLLVFHKEYEEFLAQLRQLGVVHIAEKQRGEMDDKLQQFILKRTKYRQAWQEIGTQAEVPQKNREATCWQTPEELLQAYETLKIEKQNIIQQLAHTDKQLDLMNIWGQFDWSKIKKLEEEGWTINFYTCFDRAFDEAWIEQFNAIKITSQGGRLYFITLTQQPSTIDAERIKLPDLSLEQLHQAKEQQQQALNRKEHDIVIFCNRATHQMEQICLHLEGEIDLLKVKLSTQEVVGNTVLLLEGWIPQECETTTQKFLDQSGAYYEIRNTTKADNAPIKLKNNAFVRMYEVLTSMYGMPEYGEFDPTPLLAPFFTLFFGFCMADAGYGLVLILLGFLLKAKLGKSMKGMMNLVITLGIATTVIGAILGTFFGINLFDVNIPASLKQFMVVGKIGDTSYDKQMVLALIIGVVHISIAMTVKAIVATVRYGIKESLSNWGWLLLVVGSITTATLQFTQVISEEVSGWAFISIGSIAAIGIYLLNNLRRNVLINIGAGLWDTYNMATGLMGDILSYIRLYALGLAGAMLGGVFNELGMMVQGAAGGVVGWIFCGLILIFGHTLNIAMSCLSAFVHPLRLTFVEYFKNSGYEGKGETYKPFSTVKEIQ